MSVFSELNIISSELFDGADFHALSDSDKNIVLRFYEEERKIYTDQIDI